MFKKISLDKINVKKMHSFFFREIQLVTVLFLIIIIILFYYNLVLFFKLKHKVHLSIIVCGIFHFRFRLVFTKVYISVQQKAWTLCI